MNKHIHKTKDYNKSLVLIGMMGSGKTTIAQILAEELQFVYIDTDALIEERHKISIPEIIEKKGETYFRDSESLLLIELKKNYSEEAIISTGGGIVLRTENQTILKTIGKVIWLKASSETIFRRLKDDSNRPLIAAKTENEKFKKISKINESRQEIYEKTAEFVVEVDILSPSEIVQKIIEYTNKTN